MPYSLVTDPEAPGRLYGGLDDGQVWFTADYGERWIRLELELGPIQRAMVLV